MIAIEKKEKDGNVSSNGLSVEGSRLDMTKYSNDELEEYRVLIEGMIEVAKKSYNHYLGAMRNSGENDTRDTGATFKVMEEGAMTLSKEEAGKLAQRQYDFIVFLQNALLRIKNKKYGYCYCPLCNGARISKERLRATPHATKCVRAKNN